MPVVESRGCYVFPMRQLGFCDVFCILGLVAGVSCSDPLRVGGTGSGGATGTTVLQGVFAPAGNMNSARAGHTATLLPSGTVFIAGGNDGTSAVASAEIYDPRTATFSATGSMTATRAHHTATLLGSGKVLIAAGDVNSRALGSAELYDPAAGKFAPTGSTTDARDGHTASLLGDGRVLLTGGYRTHLYTPSAPIPELDTAELYDPSTGTFSVTGTMTMPRALHAATLLPNGTVLIVGGEGSEVGGRSLASAELYDPKAGTFSAIGNMASARIEPTATLLGNGKVLVTGGYDGTSFVVGAELYDPATGRFEASSNMTVGRYVFTATLLSDRQVLMVAGYTDSAFLSSAELYNQTTGKFTATGSLTVERSDHTATLLRSGKVLVAGGSNAIGVLASAELYE
jgi:hypothetical protein